MKNLITKTFLKLKSEDRPALVTYTVAGDPNSNQSLTLLKKISKHVDIVEWGFPHNCPTADGKEIQNSSYRALENGIKLNDIFNLVKKYKRDKNAKPLILMGYYQMVFNYGEERFINKCKQVGVDGLIIVDLIWPYNKRFANLCKKKSVCFVQLIAPTTTNERMTRIIKDSHDMIYYISMLSTTGGKLKVAPKTILKNYKKINKKKNIVVGFGITDKTISSLKKADGLVVGSALVKTITDSLNQRRNPIIAAEKLVKKLKAKIT